MERRVKNDGVNAWMTGLILVWGTAFVAIRALGTVLTPIQITWFRFLPFLLLFGTWLLIWKRDRLRSLTRKDWGMYTFVGLLGVFGYHIPLYYGMQDGGPLPGPGAGAGLAAVLVATTPLWTLFFSVISGKEIFDKQRAAGSVVAFVGVLIVILFGKGTADLDLAAKAAVVLVAPILWSLYSILGKPLVDAHGGLFFAGLSMCMGIIFMIPYGFWVGFSPLAAFDTGMWLWMIYVSLAATVAGYAVWNHALQHRRPSEVTSWIYFIPVIATFASWAILGETPTLWFIAGSGLVLFGVWRINKARTAAAATSLIE